MKDRNLPHSDNWATPKYFGNYIFIPPKINCFS